MLRPKAICVALYLATSCVATLPSEPMNPGKGEVQVEVNLFEGATNTSSLGLPQQLRLAFNGKNPIERYVAVSGHSEPIKFRMESGDLVDQRIAEFANRNDLSQAARLRMETMIWRNYVPEAKASSRIVERAWEYLDTGEHELARDEFAAVAFSSNLDVLTRAEALTGTAIALRLLDQPQISMQHLHESLAIVPDYSPALNQLGIIHFNENRHALAVVAFERAAKYSAAPHKELRNLVRTLIWGVGALTETVEVLARVLGVGESDLPALVTLASLDFCYQSTYHAIGQKLAEQYLLSSTAASKLAEIISLLRSDTLAPFVQDATVALSVLDPYWTAKCDAIVECWRFHRHELPAPPVNSLSAASVHLVMEWYEAATAARNNELLHCLATNLNNSAFASIHVVTTSRLFKALKEQLSQRALVPPALFVKMDLWEQPQRVTFEQVFDHVAHRLPNNTIVVVANADVFFDESLNLLGDFPTQEQVYALLRRDRTNLTSRWRLHIRTDMQDAWVFRTPMRLTSANYSFGFLGADNRLALDLRKVGYRVTNPALRIRMFHMHASNLRTRATAKTVDFGDVAVPVWVTDHLGMSIPVDI